MERVEALTSLGQKSRQSLLLREFSLTPKPGGSRLTSPASTPAAPGPRLRRRRLSQASASTTSLTAPT
jgi:hypothetical protein